ncbi:54S ribosomal L44, mitochondrial [Lecanosticta acicola]|uniref:Large ribosomal subunit protein mL53 n=1 Tax=Lecanosticta acicola TaxID=111012 RepID=A0AAI8YZI6_9PEZI|nr:54S ribosomal L44, mitochondrial [Lecanosticta acicola]
MLTKYLTAVRTTFSPFNARSGKTARNFLALLPPNARTTMAIEIKMLPRAAMLREPSVLELKFKDGKEMKLDLEKVKIKEIQEEVNRHSRGLRRVEELSGN